MNWIRRWNRRRLQRRRATQAQRAWERWLQQDDPTQAAVAAALAERLRALARCPLISIVVVPDGSDQPIEPALLKAMHAQLYPSWEVLCAGSTPTAADERVRFFVDAPRHAAASSFNALVTHARGEWIVALRRGEWPAPYALLLLAEAAGRFPAARLVYADADHVSSTGQRHSPLLLCDPNLELLRSHDYLVGLNAVRADALRALEGLRDPFRSAAWYDLWLRLFERSADAVVHVPHLLLHRRASVGEEVAAPPPASDDALRALAGHLQRTGTAAIVSASPEGGAWVRYPIPDPAPRVTIIIPTRNGVALLRRCVSTLRERTQYPDFDILIIDNGSDDAATLEYLRAVSAEPNVRVRRDDRPFNFAALNNAALAHGTGPLLALVNNDIEAVSPHWLSEMVGHACRADVGAVGARLWYGNGTVQHAGVVLGMGGGAGHVHTHLRRDQSGYLARARLAQEFSAVTAACLVVRRAVYEQVGGMDEQELAVDMNDIDFCLRLRQASYRVIWTPHAELMHHESATRGANRSPQQLERYGRELATMRRRWAHWLDRDPAYNPNASLKNRDFEFTVTDEPRVSLRWPWFEVVDDRGQAGEAAMSLSMKNSTS